MTETQVLLSEEYVQNCFHSYLKSALTQAKVERLLDNETLSSAEGDLMITGPALCFYFAALRCTTDPPSVPLPRLNKSTGPPTDLSLNNCPVVFRPFLTIWAHTVTPIQALTPDHQHDLARIICGLPPITNPINPNLPAIAADLRAVAIEISMRRTFQDRYAADLQAALDVGAPRQGSRRVKASFVPPPVYEPTSPASSTLSIPRSPSPSTRSFRTPSPGPSPSPSSSSFRSVSPLPSPTILPTDAPAIELIRETLYAALADVLERLPSLRRMVARDPTRAYFASVALAILNVSLSYASIDKATGEPTIMGVLGKPLPLSECPAELRPFMKELCNIGKQAQEIEEDDSMVAVKALSEGKPIPVPRMDRVREVLRGGVGWVYDSNHERDGTNPRSPGERERRVDSAGTAAAMSMTDPRRRRTSTENRAVEFANRVNALSLGMTKLRTFRERQDIVFKVLVGVGS